LKNFQKDKVIYHGLVGPFSYKGVAHVLQVRVLVEMEDRVKLEIQRHSINEKEAGRIFEQGNGEKFESTPPSYQYPMSRPSAMWLFVSRKVLPTPLVW
jgi:hypothetical protein